MNRQARILTAIVGAGLLAGLLLSPRLWLSMRAYPLMPVWDWLPPITPPWDRVVFGALLGLTGLVIVLPRPKIVIRAVIGLGVLLGLEDQSRWQPWCYQYLLMLAALTLVPSSAEAQEAEARAATALNVCRFLVAAVYVWSGLQKANWAFVHDVFPWMAGPMAHLLPGIAYAVPLLEFVTGLGLMSVRGRRVAVVSAVGMHLFILARLGPWGLDWNSVVWPWNVAMIAFVGLLFGLDRTPLLGPLLKDCRRGRHSAIPALAVLLFGVLPLLSFWNCWDSYLSLTLYAGDTRHAQMTMNAADVPRLPVAARRSAVVVGNTATLDLATWSYDELNVPAYPEVRIFRRVGRGVCGDLDSPPDVQLVIEDKPNWRTGATVEHSYPCRALR